jgi:NAD(P)-dependent dehydrogenase (short-subunit alcohol dehydrogenase family)
METGLEGRRALVVGGTSGIGLAIAEALVAEGSRVAIASRRATGPTRTFAATIAADIGDERQVDAMVAEAVAVLGGLDLFVNAVARRENQDLLKVESAALERTLRTSLMGCILACRAVVPHLLLGRTPAVLVIGSTATKSAQPGETAYRAAKAGLQAHVEVMAVELAEAGVRVNLLSPGAVDTPFVADVPAETRAAVARQIPMLREATPAEIAPAAIFLLSSRLASYVTGAELVVDGGLQHRPLVMAIRP